MPGYDRRKFLGHALLGGSALAAGGYPSFGRAALNARVSVASLGISAYAVAYYVGMKEGIFAKHDWNITELLPAAPGGAAVRTIVTGGIPIGEVSATAAFGAWLVGAPIRLLTLTTRTATELLFLGMPGTKISSPKDLAGKKIGYTGPGSGTHAAALLALENLGLTGKADLVPTGGIRQALALLERGEIDVAPQLESLVKASDKYVTVFRVSDLVPKYAYSAIIASDAFVKKDPQHVESFMKAQIESAARIQQDPDMAANLWMNNTKGLELASLSKALKALNASQGWISGWDLDAVNASLKSMELTGQIPSIKGVPIAEMLDQTFIAPANRIKL
jgi:NitT/TauT family transport system substrate-binding protein